jgi:neutral ceramidase
MKQLFLTGALALGLGLSTPFVPAANAEQTTSYLVGRGMSDITGPAYGVQMWGFGREDQLTEGVHFRLRARAFIAEEPGANRLAFVSVDIGSIDHNVTLEVVDRLRAKYGDLYSLDNVILSATHTHAGPGGIWHTRTELGLAGAFHEEHYERVVSGIVEAIIQAHDNLQPGEILINKGEVEGSGANRSLTAYEQNPKKERARYSGPLDKEMTLLKFNTKAGPIGLINWHAVHPTSMTYDNVLISGDHKGFASLAFEQRMGVNYTSTDEFVAAFAQSTPGDVTPNLNLDNTGPGKDFFESTAIIGTRQLDVAVDLFENAQEHLNGAIDTRRTYVDLSDFEVEDRFSNSGKQKTCPSAYGYSFAGGSTEDGGGHFLFREGMTQQSWWLDILIRVLTGAPKWTEAVKACQTPKAILFESGTGTPPQQSQIRALTIARIGQLVILAVPAEVTTMSARRLKETVRAELGDWVKHIVIAGYSNGYAGYITTPEEYMLQQYEAGHTLHGRWTLPAYRQVSAELARALESGEPVIQSVIYDDWRGESTSIRVHDGSKDDLPKGVAFGEALPLSQKNYAPGDLVTVEFWSGNPSANHAASANFLQVEQKQGEAWASMVDDSDWSTKISWAVDRRSGALVARVDWQTSSDLETGRYRIKHFGQSTDAQGNQSSFEGRSDYFEVGEPN